MASVAAHENTCRRRGGMNCRRATDPLAICPQQRGPSLSCGCVHVMLCDVCSSSSTRHVASLHAL
eukprot:4049-Eustigmatos_ZCMA.PRE.1